MPAELADLADTFNDMLRRLEESFDRLSRFSADIAHELRTPLSNLRGQTEVALTNWTAPCSVGFSALLRLFGGYGFDFIGVDAECGELFASSFSV